MLQFPFPLLCPLSFSFSDLALAHLACRQMSVGDLNGSTLSVCLVVCSRGATARLGSNSKSLESVASLLGR